MSASGPYGVAAALEAWCDGQLEPACATVRSRYSLSSADLPRPESAAAEAAGDWLANAATKPPVVVIVWSQGPQERDNAPVSTVSAEVRILCNDAMFGGAMDAGYRAALAYAEALVLVFQAPSCITLGGAAGVLDAIRERIAVMPAEDGTPTWYAVASVSIRVQES